MATGRTDHPNQVNNVLGFLHFPGCWMWATEQREMKLASRWGNFSIYKEAVPEMVNRPTATNWLLRVKRIFHPLHIPKPRPAPDYHRGRGCGESSHGSGLGTHHRLVGLRG
jgi:hypothetical protein